MINLILNERKASSHLGLGVPTIDFLRMNKRMLGTKIGCREGDCGACTVIVGELANGGVKYRTMTSCLTPLGNVDGKHVVTIEGLNLKDLNFLQQCFVDESGTQCGFCTPGFIVSLAGFCLGDKELTLENAKLAVAGNICRCTGYKSIERALEKIVDKLQGIDKKKPVEWLVKNGFLPEYFLDVHDQLKSIAKKDTEHSDSGYILAGGTDLLIQDLETAMDSGDVNLLYNSKKLKGIKIDGGKCYIGAGTSVDEMYDSAELNKIIPSWQKYLKLISSTPIRNMATIGGNVANGSPIGDLPIMLMALDATLVMSLKGKQRELPIKEFFIGYKKINKDPQEIIETIYFDVPDVNTKFNFEKIGKRIHLDMATVNSAMKVVMDNKTIKYASFSVGGLGATIREMKDTASYLVGKELNDTTFREANKCAQGEITPRSRAEYKRLLVKQQLFCHLKSFAPDLISLEALK